jgi:aminoglycoside 3-N-acetyltransferase
MWCEGARPRRDCHTEPVLASVPEGLAKPPYRTYSGCTGDFPGEAARLADRDSLLISAQQITDAIRSLGVAPGDTMMVQAELLSSLRVEGGTREEKLATIVAGLRGAVAEGTLILPAFSYSFCRGEVFDPETSATGIGPLPEYFRTLPGVRRTLDPIFSASVLGPVPARWERRLFEEPNADALGDDGIFGFLRDVNAKLLLYGVVFNACSFAHHLEQISDVPYRFWKEFPGTVRANGSERSLTVRYFVRDLDSDTVSNFNPLGDALIEAGRARTTTIPRGPKLIVTDAHSVVDVGLEKLAEHPEYLLRRGHPDLEPARA